MKDIELAQDLASERGALTMNPIDIEYVMACVECGINRAWPNYLCEECGEPPKQTTHAHDISVVGPYHAQFINAQTVVCYQCINGEIAACANCEDSLYGYMYGTVYCDRCADSV